MRLIDADSLRFSQRYARADPDSDRLVPVFAVDQSMIDVAPTVNAVPVVRCKDCVYSRSVKWNKKGYRVCPVSHMEITDDDFCSYGERIAGNDT